MKLRIIGLVSTLLMSSLWAGVNAAERRPNILFITVDDMSCDSVGVFGCELEGTAPHIDQLAKQGLRFTHAYVQVGNCMPSRNVMYSGRYPHSNGVEGFYQVKDADYPVLCDLMKEGGCFTAIRGKVRHSTPYSPYDWDMVIDEVGERPHPKDPDSYYQSAQLGEQKIHVTLKTAENTRITREVHRIMGNGSLEVVFDVSPDQLGTAVRFAAFVGQDYQVHLQHIVSDPVPVK